MIFATVMIRDYKNISAKVWLVLKKGNVVWFIYFLLLVCDAETPPFPFSRLWYIALTQRSVFVKSGSKSSFRFFFSSFSLPISICLWRMLTSHVKLLSFSPLTFWWFPFVYLVSILLPSLNSTTTSGFHQFVSAFSWNKFWTEKENNFHFLKREYFLSVVKRCLSVISKGNRFQSLK